MIILHMYMYQKLSLNDIQFLRYGAWQTDGQTDEQKKRHIEVDAAPKKRLDVQSTC